jgi:hypothetical protein
MCLQHIGTYVDCLVCSLVYFFFQGKKSITEENKIIFFIPYLVMHGKLGRILKEEK